MDDSKNEQFPVCRAKNKQETVIAGLLGQPPHFQLDVVVFEGKGRGVVEREGVPKGAYVCEYPATLTYPRKERAGYEEEYTRNGEGCYILDCLMRDGWVCLDGTRSYSGVGRYLNHVPRSVATLTPYKPLLINGKWRVGFTATRDLLEGDELTWDYGCDQGDRIGLDDVHTRNVGRLQCLHSFVIVYMSLLQRRGRGKLSNLVGC